ncbi:entericidin EcnAB [Sulfurovum riftiae]|nr:entericidin EcnAB [Sulfurovum riftiae]
MKKTLLVLTLLTALVFLFSGCATWHGLKKDASRTWDVATA